MDTLFTAMENDRKRDVAPLAVRMRPRTVDEIVGQQHLLKAGSPLRRLAEGDAAMSVFLWGPPGVGKTSLGQSIAAGLSSIVHVCFWVTLVFAIMERTPKQKILTEIQEDWSLADLPEKEVPQKPFNKVGVIIGIIFTVLFIILVNQYSQLLGFYYTLDGSIQEMIPMLNQEVFRSYLPYINGMLVLQLLFSASKLVFRKWTYPVATANLILNVLSFVLLWFILQDTAILNPELVTKIGEATDGQRVLNTAFNSIKAVFLFIFLLDSFEGFHDAYKNSKKPA